MKVVMLAGGYGARIGETKELKPKPIIEIGVMPIILHIIKLYSGCGFNDFIKLLGYKCYVVKEYFVNYSLQPTVFIMKNICWVGAFSLLGIDESDKVSKSIHKFIEETH